MRSPAKFSLEKIVLLSFFMVLMSCFVSATCWQYTDQTNCESTTDSDSCQWRSDDWGGWCEEVGCWNYWNQSGCTSAVIPGKNCTWSGGGTSYSCSQVSCWMFEETNQTACENMSKDQLGLNCRWESGCRYSGGGASGVDCWSIIDQGLCVNTSGCGWGGCYEKGCWDYPNQNTCRAGKDWRGNNCTWDSSGSYCKEKNCWDFANQTACNAAQGIQCQWKWDSCQDVNCWSWDYTNEIACENNTANISCNWDGNWCMNQGCWNYYNANSCNNAPGCYWSAWTSSGWCQEAQCWTWDSMNGGNQTDCESNNYGISCSWDQSAWNASYGWCSVNASGIDCRNITIERKCMDTYYCWWEFVDWNHPEYGGNCSAPTWGVGGMCDAGFFNEWNPGCYIFDMNQTNCGLILGCDNGTAGSCITSSGHDNEAEINANGVNCTMVNSSSLCNNIAVLSGCCIWSGGSCKKRSSIDPATSTACWDDMQTPPAGAEFCEDYNSFTDRALCEQIAGDPWYMPCEWSNATGTCGFKMSDAFGNGTKSLIKVDNRKTCEIAGGKWFTENYCEYNGSAWKAIPSGRCEYKCNEEDNCNKVCFGCERKDKNGNVVNSTNAKSACITSPLGYCEFAADTKAPNGVGYCRTNNQFKKGIASDCNKKCGDCTYLGNSSSTTANISKPSAYCLASTANAAGGGCKWITDNTTSTGGYCVKAGEKTCNDICDRCTTRVKCTNFGRTDVSNKSGSCKWEGSDSDGYCVDNTGETMEICWNGEDDTNDGLVDCADPMCYSDSYCGFVEGDCFGWSDKTNCSTHNCEWIIDKWGQWCDFNGSHCWKYDSNESTCSGNSNCKWTNGTGGAWCEENWDIGSTCMGLNKNDCAAASGSDCVWSNDTWCMGSGNGTDWCTNWGGWCDHSLFAPKNCWMYDLNSTLCDAVDGCSWHRDEWSTPHCEMNWSSNCWQYMTSGTCPTSGCVWKTDSWGSWCANKMDQCWQATAASTCNAVSGNICYWDSWMSSCQPMCFNWTYSNNATLCNSVSGCFYKADPGWCEETMGGGSEMGCSNSTSNTQANCENAGNCRWRSSGWCDPKDGGFSGAAMGAGGGMGGAVGADCYKWDGNKAYCTNKTKINISCGWMAEPNPWCDVNWASNCWQYYSQSACNATFGCWWYNDTYTGYGWCTNLMDQCWMNDSYKSWSNTKWAENCTANEYCTNTSWGSCEPGCFNWSSKGTQANCGTGCRWITGWCNPSGMVGMYDAMEGGAPAPLGSDSCNGSETIAIAYPSVDICGFGMKDMGDSYGFGVGVYDFSNASTCNKEKLSDFVMSMAGGGAIGGGLGGFDMGDNNRIGNGNDTIKLYVYIDTDGSQTGGCSLSYNTSAVGYEFRFNYIAKWNVSLGKTVETFNAYKCENSKWVSSDVKLSAWKKKMCSEIGGPMIAVEKTDLARFPSLYDPTKDIRVIVATADRNHNVSFPSDTVSSAGWTTPGAIDFEIKDMFGMNKSGSEMAKYEETLRRCYTVFEDCWNGIDDDMDGDIDCDDWNCQYAKICEGLGVNAAGYSDTSSPLVLGVKIEEYNDSAIIMYDTNKPANGTLLFYYNDSTCSRLNTTIYDVGVRINNSVREYKLWHTGELYKDNSVANNSLDYALVNDTQYYYKLKVCDSGGKCSYSKCSSFVTGPSTKCGYCNFIARIVNAPGWNVYFDIDQNGVYEYWQGHLCGPKAGMKANHTSGRRVNIKLNDSSGTSSIEFFNATLTRTGLNTKVRNISTSRNLKNGTTTDAAGVTLGYIGMISETRDKIINNLHPERCIVTFPTVSARGCGDLWHCESDGTDCINRTSEGNLTNYTTTTCTWEIPFCEFSLWGGGEPGNPPGGSPGGGGGGGSSTSPEECGDGVDNDGDGLIDYPNDPGCKNANDQSEKDIECVQQWVCTDWGECADDMQTRTCSDKNNCELKLSNRDVASMAETEKPVESKGCDEVIEGEEGVLEQIFGAPGKTWIWAVIILVVILGAGIGIYYYLTEKKGKKKK